MREKKNPGGLVCRRIATSHQCVTALTNTQRCVRSSIPFQGRVTDLGFSSLPPRCWKPSQELLLWEQYRELLCPAGIQFISQFQLILSDCAMAFYLPIFRNTPAPQPGGSNIQPTLWHLGWERLPSTSLPVAQTRAKQPFGTTSILWVPPWQQTAPWISHRHLQADPAPASWRDPGYFKASPAGLMQPGCSHTIGSQLSHGSCGCCGDALSACQLWHQPTPSLSSQLHSFSTYQKGWLEVPLLCLWMCLCLEANQKHSCSRAQLWRE